MVLMGLAGMCCEAEGEGDGVGEHDRS